MNISKILFSTTLVVFLSSCFFFQNCIAPKGDVISHKLDLGKIHSIDLESSIKVIINQASVQSIEVRAPQNYFDEMNKEVKDGEWDISFKRCLKKGDLVEVYLSVTDLEEIGISGSGSVIGEGVFNGEELELQINGSGNISMEAEYKELEVGIAGSGDIKLGGKAKEVEVEINGSGDVSMEDLVSDNSLVKINGSGDVRVNATNTLKVNINGSGDVFYKGKPRDIDSNINGSGDLTQID